MDKIEQNIKKYYSSKTLPEEKVNLLLDKNRKKNKSWVLSKIVIAAMLVIGFVFTMIQFQAPDIEELIVKEIAMNHNKELSVEFPTDDLPNLQAKLDKLDFPLDKAEGVISDKYILMGGRYCSIQGNLAAQLKIINEDTDSIETLYVTGLNSELTNVKPTNVNTEGINIKIWKQDGLLYGIASNIEK
ncbi:MAG: hypothetical protein WBB48_01325 [Thermodesulfobacteriota bacterium]